MNHSLLLKVSATLLFLINVCLNSSVAENFSLKSELKKAAAQIGAEKALKQLVPYVKGMKNPPDEKQIYVLGNLTRLRASSSLSPQLAKTLRFFIVRSNDFVIKSSALTSLVEIMERRLNTEGEDKNLPAEFIGLQKSLNKLATDTDRFLARRAIAGLQAIGKFQQFVNTGEAKKLKQPILTPQSRALIVSSYQFPKGTDPKTALSGMLGIEGPGVLEALVQLATQRSWAPYRMQAIANLGGIVGHKGKGLKARLHSKARDTLAALITTPINYSPKGAEQEDIEDIEFASAKAILGEQPYGEKRVRVPQNLYHKKVQDSLLALLKKSGASLQHGRRIIELIGDAFLQLLAMRKQTPNLATVPENNSLNAVGRNIIKELIRKNLTTPNPDGLAERYAEALVNGLQIRPDEIRRLVAEVRAEIIGNKQTRLPPPARRHRPIPNFKEVHG